MMAIGPGPNEEPADLAGEIVQRWREARDHWSRWRDEARLCFRYYAGHQWSEEDLALLAEEMRPAIVFNRIAPLIDAVLGHEANNRAALRFLPRTQGDVRVAELLTNASAYFRDHCDAEHEESDAFRDALICGLGWTHIRLSDDTNPEYDLIDERIDPLEVLPDPAARKPNLADARWLVREKYMSPEEVRSLWPECEAAHGEALRGSEIASRTASGPRDAYRGDADDAVVPEGILVLEYQWKDTEVRYRIARPDTGEIREIDREAWDSQKAEIEALGLDVSMRRTTRIRRAFLIGDEVVQQDTPSPRHFSYTAITGKRDHATGTWFGIVRSLIDPQSWANKWLSQMLHIVNVNAKGGVMLERSAALDVAEFEERWADPAGIIWLNDGALRHGQVQPKPPPMWPSGVERLLEHAMRAFSEVSGVNAELLGLVDRQQPGVLEWQRKQSAVTLLAPLFDSLRRFRKMKGRTWLWWMRTYVGDGRLVRIVSDDGREGWLPFWRDAEIAEYDVVVDQSATAPNVKEATWSTLIQLFPALQGMIDPQIMLMLLQYSPLPETLIAKLRAYAAERSGQPSPPDPRIAVVMAGLEAEKARSQGELALKQQQARAEIALKREQVAADLVLEREKALVEANADIEVARLKAGLPPSAEGIVSNAIAAAPFGGMPLRPDPMAALAETVERSVEAIVAALSRPKTLIRDAQGRAVGVQ